MRSEENLKRENLLSFPEVLSKISLENYEKSLFIIDIDGVLLNLTPKVFLEGLFLYLFSQEKFKKFKDRNKIPIGYLLRIKKLRESGADIVLFTSRFFSRDKNFFPFISEETIERFKKSNISIITHPKFLPKKLPQELLDKVNHKEEIFYIGSGKLDERVFDKLKAQYKGKTFKYFSVGSGIRLI